MSLKKIGQIKDGKWFRLGDLIVYGVIIALFTAFILVAVLTRDSSPTDGIRVSYKGESVFEYYYESDEYKILKRDNVEVKENGGERLVVTFYTDGKRGFNEIVFDKTAKSCKVRDADCSTHRDCVYSAAIEDNGTVIHCPPPSLAIEPLKRSVNPDDDVVIG